MEHDKDGIVAALLSAEITARSGRDPAETYRALTRELGDPAADRVEAPATADQKRRLAALSPADVHLDELGGERVERVLDRAPGNQAPIGGIKVVTASGWFAARPSGTEDIYKIYGSDYFENSRRATYVQREYAERNPREHVGYDEQCWGLTACDGPSDEVAEVDGEPRRLFGYAARGVPYGPDDGTVAAWASLASLPFAPEIVLPSVRAMIERYPEMVTDQKLASSFNPGLATADRPVWVSPGHFGLDQGIVTMMIENHRTGLPWRLMRDCPPLVTGLRRAGFRGGWL